MEYKSKLRWDAENRVPVTIKFNIRRDADILARLSSLDGESRQDFIRRCIRREIQEGLEEHEQAT